MLAEKLNQKLTLTGKIFSYCILAGAACSTTINYIENILVYRYAPPAPNVGTGNIYEWYNHKIIYVNLLEINVLEISKYTSFFLVPVAIVVIGLLASKQKNWK